MILDFSWYYFVCSVIGIRLNFHSEMTFWATNRKGWKRCSASESEQVLGCFLLEICRGCGFQKLCSGGRAQLAEAW